MPDPPSRSYEPSHVIQQLVEIQKDLVVLKLKMDDITGLKAKVDDLRESFVWVKGFAAAAVILIPLCAAIIWFFVGDQFKQIKAQLTQTRPAVATPGGSTADPPRPGQ